MSMRRMGAAALMFGFGCCMSASANPCTADVKSYCAGVKIGGGRILSCLKDHFEDLNPACRDPMVKSKGIRATAAKTETADHQFSLEHGGRNRKYIVHVPPGHDKKVPMPVVIYLHGGGGSIQSAHNEGIDKSADKFGFLLISPDGTGPFANRAHTWNSGKCCGYAMEKNIDDVGFISKMIDEVKARYVIDERRIFATGISNGGMLTYRLACELAGKIAAVAPVSTTRVPDDCSPSRPVSVMHVHGTADPLAPFKGGNVDKSPWGPLKISHQGQSASQMVGFWIHKNRCSPDSETVYQKGKATCIRHDRCAEGVAVELCAIEGGGHTWPSGMQYASIDKIGPVSYDLSFEQIWAFLKAHPMPDDNKR